VPTPPSCLRLQHGLEVRTFRLPTFLIYSLVQQEPPHSDVQYLYRQNDSLKEQFPSSVSRRAVTAFLCRSIVVLLLASAATQVHLITSLTHDSAPRGLLWSGLPPLSEAPSDRSFPAHSIDLRMPNSLFVCVHCGLQRRQLVRRGRHRQRPALCA